MGILAKVQGLDREKQGFICGVPRSFLPPGPSRASRFLLLLSGALGRGTKPHVGHSCPQRGKGLRRNRFTLPPPHPSPLPGPLCLSRH